MLKASMVPVAGSKTRLSSCHNVYTPSPEADICLNCPLKECSKSTCERFKEEKKKLKTKRDTHA